MHEDERENEQGDVDMCLFQYLLLPQYELRRSIG